MENLYVVLLSFVSSYTSSLPLPFYFIDLTSRQYLSTTPLYTGLPIITLVIQAVWGGRITTTNLWFIFILWRRVLISSLSREQHSTKKIKLSKRKFRELFQSPPGVCTGKSSLDAANPIRPLISTIYPLWLHFITQYPSSSSSPSLLAMCMCLIRNNSPLIVQG